LNKEKMGKDIYKEDVDKMMIEIMEVIDKHVGYEWSGTKNPMSIMINLKIALRNYLTARITETVTKKNYYYLYDSLAST